MPRRLTVLAVASFLALTACSAGSGSADDSGGTAAGSGGGAGDPRLAKLYETAKSEGEVVWYSAFVDDLNASVVKEFEAAYPGIKVNVLRVSGAEAAQRFAAEAQAGANAADVMTHTNPGFSKQAFDKGWTIDMTAKEVPTLADYPPDYLRPGGYVINQAPTTIIINTDLVKNPPTSFEDLLKPEYKNQVLVVDPRTIPVYMAQYDLIRQKYGADYFSKLIGNGAKIVDSMVPGGQTLAAGEAKAGFPGVWAICKSLADTGAPVKCVEVAPLTAAEGELVLAKNAPHPNAARLFAGWLATKKGQEVVNANVSVSPLGDLSGTIKRNPAMVSPDFEAANAHAKEITGALKLG